MQEGLIFWCWMGFRGGDGEGSGTGGGMYCEVSYVVHEWEGILSVSL